jgi:cytoskeletal protein RodZ
MTYFGETLRKAREAKGLTTSQVAEKTRILVQIINAMEKEDFSRIKAAIYGRGFVKLICECLEIDPKPLVAEFMDIYEGRRPPITTDAFQPRPAPPPKVAAPPAATPEPAIVSAATPEPAIVSAVDSESPIIPAATSEPPASSISLAATEAVPVVPDVPAVSPAPEAPEPPPAAEAPEPPPTPEVPEAVKGLDLFDPQPPVVSAEPPSATRAQDIFASAYATPEPEVPAGPSAAEKFRNGLSVVSHGVIGSVRRIPRSAWRMAVLAIGAGVVIALLVWGCVILYRVTEHPVMDPDNPPSTIVPPQTQPAAKPAQATKPATPAAKPAPKAVNAPKTSKGPAKPKQMRSTGQKVPPLYVD